MAVDAFRMFELAAQGFCCSQILLILGLEEQGKENPDLIKAMNGLCGGLGRAGKVCGVLTGGVCLLGLYAGKGTAGEYSKYPLNAMVNELLEWFEGKHGSTECFGIIDDTLDSETEYPVKCGNIVLDTYEKIQAMLKIHKIDDDVENGDEG